MNRPAMTVTEKRRAERQQRTADILGEWMGGYVQCDCGSKNVVGHERRDRKGRIVQMVYRCVDCQATSETPRRRPLRAAEGAR